jgi:hypothetical protein
MQIEPEPVMEEPMNPRISQKSQERERRPDDGVCSQKRCRYITRALLQPNSVDDQVDHRHA